MKKAVKLLKLQEVDDGEHQHQSKEKPRRLESNALPREDGEDQAAVHLQEPTLRKCES